MANWQGVQEGLTSGYKIGRDTGGGRLGHLGGLIAKVADKLRAERESGVAMGQKRDILGMEEASKVRILQEEARLNPKSPAEWKPRTGNEALMFEKAKAGVKKTPEAIVDDKGNIIGYRPAGAVFQPRPDPTEAIIAALGGGGTLPAVTSTQKPKGNETLINQYMKKYPDRKRADIEKAMRKQGLL